MGEPGCDDLGELGLDLPAVLARVEPYLASYGGLTREVLLQLIAQARDHGHAVIKDFAVPGVTSSGVPIRDRAEVEALQAERLSGPGVARPRAPAEARPCR